MFRHVVLMTWQPDATDVEIEAVHEGLRALPGQIEEIRSYSFGRDAGASPDNADLAVIADFDDEAGFREYVTHPSHVALVTDKIRPILLTRVAVQYERDAAAG